MGNMDRGKERQVWQRVMAGHERGEGREDLRMLTLSAQEAAGAYRYVAAQLTGPSRDLARRLQEEEQATVAALWGLHRLSGGGGDRPKPMPAPQGGADKVLARYYHRARKTAAEYMARSVEPETGAVFRSLAQREESHCLLIAQLLGRG